MEEVRLLLVDDEVEFLETLIKRMRKRRVEAVGVRSGEDALKYLEEHPTDVVVLDVKMPGMDGIETLKAIKERHPLTEVIMLTGHANLEVAIRGMELGAFDYLMKPMDIDELLYKVEDAHKKKKLQEKRMQGRKGVGGHGETGD
ncbi:MAG: response regulator [Desulfacinum sp.]|jgi:DNA-binding NtrC family response regulator|nr:response regulator [Desulfacinum sp.]